jgi:hypothetical protein
MKVVGDFLLNKILRELNAFVPNVLNIKKKEAGVHPFGRQFK